MCGSDAVRKEVVQALSTLGRSAGLKGFELVKDVRLEAGGLWTPTDEECILTPTFKLKRKQVLCSSVQQFGLPFMCNSHFRRLRTVTRLKSMRCMLL